MATAGIIVDMVTGHICITVELELEEFGKRKEETVLGHLGVWGALDGKQHHRIIHIYM